jgi:hypothetical protein
MLNFCFAEIVDEKIQHNNCHLHAQVVQKKIDYYPNSHLYGANNQKRSRVCYKKF